MSPLAHPQMEKIVVGVVQRNQPVYISPVDDVFEEHSLPCSLFLFLNHLSLPAVAKHGGFKKKSAFSPLANFLFPYLKVHNLPF